MVVKWGNFYPSLFCVPNKYMPTRNWNETTNAFCRTAWRFSPFCALLRRCYSEYNLSGDWCHAFLPQPIYSSVQYYLRELKTGNVNWRVNPTPLHNVNHLILFCWCWKIIPELWKGCESVKGCSSGSLSGNMEQDMCVELADGSLLELPTSGLKNKLPPFASNCLSWKGWAFVAMLIGEMVWAQLVSAVHLL